MKLLIVSDTHGRYERLREACELHKDVDALVFLGDGISDIDRAGVSEFGFTIFAVRGNWDYSNSSLIAMKAKNDMTLEFEGVKIYALHGHTKQVKSGILNALYAAAAVDADVLLYGHTHEQYYTFLEGNKYNIGKDMHVFNPGSLGGYYYGLCEIKDGKAKFEAKTLF